MQNFVNSDVYLVLISVFICVAILCYFRFKNRKSVLGELHSLASHDDRGGEIGMSRPNSVLLLGEVQRPLMRIEVTNIPVTKNYLDLSAENAVTALSPIAALAGVIAAQSPNLAGDCIKLSFSPELIQGIANGSHEIMKAVGGGFREMVVNSETGKIVGHGKFTIANGPQNLALASIGFQVASVVVGQAHMAQITSKLKEIDSKIDDIVSFLDEQRQAKVRNGVAQLRTISAVMFHENLETSERITWNSMLIDIENEMSEVFEHFRIESTRRLAALEAVNNSDTFGTQSTHSDLKKTLKEFERFYAGWKGAYVLVSACRVSMLRSATKATIGALANKISECDVALVEKQYLDALYKYRTKALTLLGSSLFNKAETLHGRRSEVIQEIDKMVDVIAKDMDVFRGGLEKCQQHASILEHALNKGMDVFAEIGNDGSVKKVLLSYQAKSAGSESKAVRELITTS